MTQDMLSLILDLVDFPSQPLQGSQLSLFQLNAVLQARELPFLALKLILQHVEPGGYVGEVGSISCLAVECDLSHVVQMFHAVDLFCGG